MSVQQDRIEASRSFRERHILAPACFLVALAGAYGFYAFATAGSGTRTWSRSAESAAEFENDPEIEKVVWATQGPWKRQHSPVLLDDGNILLFDNRGLGQRSRVIQFDPKTETINWVYGEKPSQQFYSFECGMCQRLPNGNTLITASALGKAIEVTPGQEVVWEFVCPLRHEHKVATLFQVHRLPADFPMDWLEDL